jgi:hypothetical protein
VAGDEQTGTSGTPLRSPIVFAVKDAEGRPLAGVPVALAVAAGGGTIPGQNAITSGEGTVATQWTLGVGEGPQALEARVSGIPSVRATARAAACAPPECPPTPDNVIELLALQTYDQSGQVVHPDVASAAELGGYPFWLGITPYPGGDAAYENPSIFRSLDGRAWQVPEGLSNPVVRPGVGYLSDPDVLFDAADHRLSMYYRQVVGARNVIHLSRSGDGVHWSSPLEVVSAPSHELVSPAVVRGAPAAAWAMWSVNSGPGGCRAARTVVERRTSEDGERWGAAEATDLAQPGQVVWHIDVQWIPARGEYWALYNTYPAGGSCTTNALYLARSPDGLRWATYPSAVLRSGAIDAFRDIVYRSTFAVDPQGERVTFWFSGASYEGGRYVWRAATESRRIADLLGGLERPDQPGATTFSARTDLPPPEPADMPVGP